MKHLLEVTHLQKQLGDFVCRTLPFLWNPGISQGW